MWLRRILQSAEFFFLNIDFSKLTDENLKKKFVLSLFSVAYDLFWPDLH